MQVHLYADDCQIYISFHPESAQLTENIIMACLSDIKEWMNKSFLKLNPNKTNFILLNSKVNLLDNANNLPIKINFNNANVPPLETVVSLGVSLSNNLDFSKFISKKVQACSFHLRNLIHVKKSLTTEIKIILVTNIILSNIDYCNSLLANATNKDLKPLQRVINRSIRFIFNLRKHDHISQYAFRVHFLPIFYRIKFKICLLAYKIINGMSPDYLMDDLEMFQPTTTINLREGQGRDRFMFKYPPIRSNHNSLSVKLVIYWNELPYEIRTANTISKYKARLKTHLFRKAYPNFTNNDA